MSEVHLAQHALHSLPRNCPWAGAAFSRLDAALKGEKDLQKLYDLHTNQVLDPELVFTPDFSFPLETPLPAGVSCLSYQKSLGGARAQHQVQRPSLAWLAEPDL